MEIKKSAGQPRALVLCGDGLNCEQETSLSFIDAGFKVDIIPLNFLIEERWQRFDDYQVLCLPGGFSFGDELGSGQVLASKMKNYLADDLQNFIAQKKPIIGICNGFQVLTKLQLLSSFPLALAKNSSEQFINKWVPLNINLQSPCVWIKKIQQQKMERIELPIRHGEGRFVYPAQENLQQQIVLTYAENIHGAESPIAGVCDPTGLIFGLMPHPEGWRKNILHPQLSITAHKWQKGLGQLFFESAYEWVVQS